MSRSCLAGCCRHHLDRGSQWGGGQEKEGWGFGRGFSTQGEASCLLLDMSSRLHIRLEPLACGCSAMCVSDTLSASIASDGWLKHTY